MKIFLLNILILLNVISLQAKKYTIDYKPNGIIIVFKVDSVNIFTDLISINNISDTNIIREKQWILSKIEEEQLNDTITFTEKWPINNLLIYLIKMNNVKIVKANNQISEIKIKKRNKYNGAFKYIEFTDLNTNKIFFTKNIIQGFINPRGPQF